MVAAACAGSQRPGAHAAEPDPCVLIAPPQAPPESITVALSSTDDGFLVAQSSETLLGVNCRARPYAKLGQAWSTDRVADGLRWTITIDTSNASSRVHVRSIEPTAARDALDDGVDLLITDDPAIVSYAARNEQLLTLPLLWDRTYVVLASESAASDVSATRHLTLADIVADAVRADFRIAERPFWWESNNHCAVSVGTRPAPANASSRVVYPSGDRVAQGIAERFVALAGSRSAGGGDSVLTALLPRLSRLRTGATAAGLSPSALTAALRSGDDLAYVLPLPRFAAAPCQEFAMLQRSAPWLQSVIPLIDTRSTALVRRNRVGLAVDTDGSLRLLDGASGKSGKP